jgi:hypothetical protein
MDVRIGSFAKASIGILSGYIGALLLHNVYSDFHCDKEA